MITFPGVDIVAPGWTPVRFTTNLNKTGNQVKATGGKLGYLNVRNTDASNPLYVSVYDAATKTGTPKLQIEIPPGSAWDLPMSLAGFAFTTGIFVALSSNLAVSSDPSTAVNVLNAGYV